MSKCDVCEGRGIRYAPGGSVKCITCNGTGELTADPIGQKIGVSGKKGRVEGVIVDETETHYKVVDPETGELILWLSKKDYQDLMNRSKMFPIQDGDDITWELAEKVYEGYAKRYGRKQSLNDFARRGGFSQGEVEMFLN